MVWFTFTFLLGVVNNNGKETNEKSKKREIKYEGKEKCMELEVSKPNFYCHIEYVLLPNKPLKVIDVVSWDGAAKVYFENSTCAMMPKVTGNLRWIHFRVNHKIKISSEQIILLHRHNIKITLSLGGKNSGEAAKFDKTKKFYGPEFPENQEYFIPKQLFQPLSETLEDLPRVSFLKDHLTPTQQLYVSLDSSLETYEYRDKLYGIFIDLNNEYHDKNAIKIPTPSQNELPPLKNILNPPSNIELVVKQKTSDKKVTETKQKEPPIKKIEFFISGEEFFSGNKTIEKCLKYNSEELPYVFCLGSVKNLLSKTQLERLNPLTITIKHIKHLPADDLARNGITQLKFQYLICNQFMVESELIPVSNDLRLNYSRTILTNEINKNHLLEFIQTKGLEIYLLGNFFQTENNKKTNLYEGILRKKKLSLSKEKKNSEKSGIHKLILLGKVSLDISSILFQPHKSVLKCDFFLTPYDFLGNENPHYCNTENMEILRENFKKNLKTFPSSMSCPEMTVKVALSYSPLHLTTLKKHCTYNRLFAVFYDPTLAIPVIKMIQDEVVEFLEPLDTFKNDKSLRRPKTKKVQDSDTSIPKNMTGFLIDCIDNVFIYVESSAMGEVQKIWALVSSMNPDQGHVLYDSTLVFSERLYKNFFKFGGFFTMAFKEMSQMLIFYPKHFKKKKLSESAREVLKSINLLLKCKSIKTAILFDLLPHQDCLKSLAEECGVPVLGCEKMEVIN